VSPRRKPTATAWARLRAWSFASRWRTCDLTVSSERKSRWPISRLTSPSETSWRTSISRAVGSCSRWRRGGGVGALHDLGHDPARLDLPGPDLLGEVAGHLVAADRPQHRPLVAAARLLHV